MDSTGMAKPSTPRLTTVDHCPDRSWHETRAYSLIEAPVGRP
jgi:hypothetical protein